jgi:phenylacetate-coenzyme A ligase PaaK-like adenylate-forming protein
MLEFRAETAAERLEYLLFVAKSRVPRYEALRELKDASLTDFPLTYKADLRERFVDSISRGPMGEMEPGRYFLSQTSGSTGQPAPILTTAEHGGLANVVVHERLCQSVDLPTSGVALNLGLGQKNIPLITPVLLPRPYVRWNLLGFNPDSPDIVADYEAVVGRFDVDKISGSSSRLIFLASYCQERGIQLRPKAVIATYEHMPQSGRELIEDVFQCRVTMLYMTAETGHAAWECRHGMIHFQDDFVLPEVVMYDGIIEIGQVVLTALMSTPMPVIRYVTGDMAPAPAACACGLPGTVITGLVGRARSSLVATDGSLYSPYVLLKALSDIGLSDFQVVQYDVGILELRSTEPLDIIERAAETVNSRLLMDPKSPQGFQLRATASPFVLTALGKRNPVVQNIEISVAPERIDYLRF